MDELLETKTSGGYISLRTVLRTRLLLGFYCPLSQGTPHRILAWLYCLFYAFLLTTTIIKIKNDRETPIILLLPLIIEYSANVIISLLTGEYHFFNFLKGAQLTDGEMGYDLPFMSQATRCIYVIVVVEKICVWFSGYFSWSNSVLLVSASTTMSLATNLNCLITVLPLDLLRTRLQKLRHGLKINLSTLSINNADDQIKALWNYLRQYRNMIDNLSRCFFWEKLRISLSLTCCFFSFLANGSSLAFLLKYENERQSLSFAFWVTRTVTCMFLCVPPCLPAVFSELVSREVDRLKIAVGDLLLTVEDERLQSELEYAAQYLELRPFSISICRVCTLDGSLVLGLVSLCISYLILISQITAII